MEAADRVKAAEQQCRTERSSREGVEALCRAAQEQAQQAQGQAQEKDRQLQQLARQVSEAQGRAAAAQVGRSTPRTHAST